MNKITIYDQAFQLSAAEEKRIAAFLFHELGQYGDPLKDIRKAIDYALQRNQSPGGLIAAHYSGEALTAAVVVNATGMTGYIPEHILVYIATHQAYRGQGIGKRLMQAVIDATTGNIALHVEPDNPARKLYEALGFTSKYLEMRLHKP